MEQNDESDIDVDVQTKQSWEQLGINQGSFKQGRFSGTYFDVWRDTLEERWLDETQPHITIELKK